MQKCYGIIIQHVVFDYALMINLEMRKVNSKLRKKANKTTTGSMKAIYIIKETIQFL